MAPRPAHLWLRLGAATVLACAMVGWPSDARPELAGAVELRLNLQRELGAWLEGALRAIAHPHRLMVTVRVVTRDELKEVVSRESQPDTELKVNANRTVQLPGLPMVDKPITGFGSPDISVKVPGRQRTEMHRELFAYVERTAVQVFVQRGAPAALLEKLKRSTIELAALDTARGDTVEVTELSEGARPELTRPAPGFLEANGGLLAVCATALLSAVALALGLGSRGRAPVALSPGEGAAAPRALPPSDGEGSGLPEDVPVPVAEPGPTVPRGPSTFGFLSQASTEQLADVLALLSPEAAAVVLDQVPLDAPLGPALFARLPLERQLALAQALGRPHVLSQTEFNQIERATQAALADVRSRVKVGSEGRLADLISLAPGPDQALLLEALRQQAPELASAVRGRMLLFDDLPRLGEAAIRQVATAVDPAVVALALKGAGEPLREAVHRAVSTRLKGMLAAEESAVAAKGPAEVDGARRQLEQVMRRLQAQGQLGAPA